MTIYDPSAPSPPPEETWRARPAALVTHLVVVPAAVIAMVAALLFYLVDVRSAFLGGSHALKWVGLCFATATVLIERYRQASDTAELQGCYKVALAGATVLVLLAESWETRPSGLGGKLANLLIVAVVWLFATGITRGLSPERRKRAGGLQDLERLHLGTWLRANKETTLPPNPAAAVARLAALALLAFALGEPTLLEAAPQTGERALAAVVVFLLATGVALAAGSSMSTLRRVEKAGGSVSPNLVPGRVALAALLMVAVLAAALAVPESRCVGLGACVRRPLPASAARPTTATRRVRIRRGRHPPAIPRRRDPEAPRAESRSRKTPAGVSRARRTSASTGRPTSSVRPPPSSARSRRSASGCSSPWSWPWWQPASTLSRASGPVSGDGEERQRSAGAPSSRGSPNGSAAAAPGALPIRDRTP